MESILTHIRYIKSNYESGNTKISNTFTFQSVAQTSNV